MVAGGYNVSVSLTMVDHVSKTLSKIEKNMQSTITAADNFAKATNLIAQNVGWWANNTDKLVTAMSNLKGVMKSMPTAWRIQPSKANHGLLSPAQSVPIPSTKNVTPTGAETVRASINSLTPAMNGLVMAQKQINSEFSKMTNFTNVDTSAIETSFGRMSKSLHGVLKAQDEFVTSAHAMGINTISDETLTAMRATENAIDAVTTAYQRFEAIKAKGDNISIEELKSSYNELSVAMNKVKTLQSQIETVMKRTDLPDEEYASLKKTYHELDIAVNQLTQDQRSLAQATNNMISNPKFIRPTIDEIRKLDGAIDVLINTEEQLQKETKESTTAMDKFNNELGETVTKTNSSNTALSGLKSMLTRLGGAYLGLETVKTAFNWSDEIILTEGKLAQLTDDVEGFMDKAYQMSQDTRTSFTDNASQMAKMWQLTGGTEGIFETEDKLIEFNELLNKAFTLGGSGTREINASLYQLTQALSSGRLQGDELRSLSENAPYLINSIIGSIEDMYNAGKDQSEWIDLTYNDLKKLGAEGVITSELVTDAVLNSADDIRKAFENITPTWEQTFQTLKNQVQKVSTPILKTLNDLINSEGFTAITQSLIKMFAIIMALLNPIIQGIMWLGELMADNWGAIEPILWGVVGALGAYLTYLALAKVYTVALGIVQGFQLLMSKGVGLSLVENNVALGIYNGLAPVAATMSNMLGAAKAFLAGATWSAVVAEYGLIAPLLLIIAVIGAVIGAIYLIVYAYNKWTDSTISATGIIVGAFYAMYAYIYNVIAQMWNELVTFAEFLCNLFTHPQRAIADFGIAVIDILLAVNDAVMNIFGSMSDMIGGFVKEVGKAINWAVEGSNAVLGTNFQKVEWEDATDPWESTAKTLNTWRADIDAWGGKDRISLDEYRMEKKNVTEYYNKGYGKGVEFDKWIGEMFDTSKLLEGMGTDFDPDDYTSGVPGLEDYVGSLKDYDQPNVGGSADLPDDLKSAIDGIKGNTDDLVEMGEEELKYLRDIAEQKVINRFTTAEIKVTNNMNNNINSDRDIDGMADYFAQVIERACETTAERVNAIG